MIKIAAYKKHTLNKTRKPGLSLITKEEIKILKNKKLTNNERINILAMKTLFKGMIVN